MVIITIFDHDKSIIELHKKRIKTLKDKRFIIHTFSSEEDVLNFIKTNRVDILITECIKDNMRIHGLEHNCGLEFLKKIKAHGPNIKIMICSTYSYHWVNSSIKNVVGIKKPTEKNEFLKIFTSLIKTG